MPAASWLPWPSRGVPLQREMMTCGFSVRTTRTISFDTRASIPLAEGLGHVLRVTVVHGTGEGDVDAVILRGTQKFHGTKGAQAVEEVTGHEIGAGLAARQTEHGHVDAAPASEQCEGRTVFIVRVGRYMKDARRGLQLEQGAPESGGAAILRKRFRGEKWKGENTNQPTHGILVIVLAERAIAGCNRKRAAGGKSGLHRAACRLTAGGARSKRVLRKVPQKIYRLAGSHGWR